MWLASHAAEVAQQHGLGQIGAEAGERFEILEAGALALGVARAQRRAPGAARADPPRAGSTSGSCAGAAPRRRSARGRRPPPRSARPRGGSAPRRPARARSPRARAAARASRPSRARAPRASDRRCRAAASGDGGSRRRRPGRVGRALELVADHPQRQEGVALQRQDAPQPLDVRLGEEAVAAARAMRLEQALILEVADLRDREIRELGAQQLADGADRESAGRGRGLDAGCHQRSR